MTQSVPSTVTGGAQTGLTSPTYNTTADSALTTNAKAFAVTAVGGTQPGVRVHTPPDPFLLTLFRPARWKKALDSVVGALFPKQPINTTGFTLRKGVICSALGHIQELRVRYYVEVPAGAEIYDPNSVRAAMSFANGYLSMQGAQFGDTVITSIQ